MPKLIVLAGLSIVGKTTLAGLIAHEENAKVLAIGNIMRDFARQKGFSDFKVYLNENGFEKSLKEMRNEIFARIKEEWRAGNNLVLEGLYDYLLFRKIEGLVGRKNIDLIGLSASRHVKKRRAELRYKIDAIRAVKKIKSRDALKQRAGLPKILTHAQLNIRPRTVSEGITAYRFWRKSK